MTLQALAAATSAIVSRINAPRHVRRRLFELGLVPGAELEVILKGSSSLVLVDGGRVTLTRDLAASVEVIPR